MKITRRIVSRFMEKVEVGETMQDCWVWRAGCRREGKYGAFWIGDRQYLAHRVAYMIWRGIIPEGQQIAHKCDNSRCVNPLHLVVNTKRVNTSRY